MHFENERYFPDNYQDSIFYLFQVPHFLGKQNWGAWEGVDNRDPHAGGGNDSIVIISIGLSSVVATIAR